MIGANPHPYRWRPRPRQGARRQARAQTEAHSASEARGNCAPRTWGRNARRDRPQLQCQRLDDFASRRI